jgi:dynein heavy chain 1
MYMITRDSNARFTPDLCSRVTFVNFTITPSSLEDQCLNILLKNERPDTEEKRLNLMKLQGEYIVKLRELEDSLLDALNHVQGSILESESVITTLEKLKTEASKVTEEMKQSNDVLAEVETVTNSYKPLAQAASKIFFALLGMSNLHYLYEYSLQFFMDTIFSLLENEERLNSISKKEFDKRKAMINHLLFERVFLRVCNSLLTKDVNIFALKLAEIKLEKETTELFSYLYKPTIILKTSLSNNILDGHLTESQLKQVEELMHCKVFEELLLDMEKNSTQWKQFLESANPE